MKQLFYIITFLVCITFAANAQIRIIDTQDLKAVPETELSPRFDTALIDSDNKIDTLFYDYDKESLVFLLSTKNHAPRSFHMPGSWGKTITAQEGGIQIRDDYMRRSIYYDYSYEEDKNDFRLVDYYNDYLGSVTNDGAGTASWDLITGEFEAEWAYYDEEIEELIPMPTIRLIIPHKPLYLSMDEVLEEPSLFDSCKNYYINERKIYEKRIRLYSDNILAFEKYSAKWRAWQTPVLIVEDGTTIYLEETDDRGVYYYYDLAPSGSRKFMFMCQYYTTLEFPGSDNEILKFSRGIIIDSQTGKELLSLSGTDVAGEWNDDEWVSGDQILFSPLGFDDDESETETRTIQLSDNVTVHVRQIPQDEYEARKKASEHLRQKPYEVIKDFDQAAKMLNGRLKFAPVEGIKMYDIYFEDGTKKQIESEDGFRAYYPQLGLLVFIGGHMTDEIFDLRERDFVAGNPRYHAVSPDGSLRINGSHDGQDALMRFLDKWNPAEKRYEFVNWLFGEDKIYDYENCYIYECCWTSNNTAIYQNFGGEKTYYEIEFVVTHCALKDKCYINNKNIISSEGGV